MNEAIELAWTWTVHDTRPAVSVGKRLTDICLSGLLLVVLSPVFLLVMAAIRLTSPGPVFFVQKRIGFRCRVFRMHKFRTMVDGAERLEARLARRQPGRTFFKLEKDPRTTPLGRFLRKYSIDELPQLYDVLRGDMSLVGPRPLLLSDFDKYPKQDQMRRFAVKPGLTGLWQVDGRSLCSDDERMRLDLQYVDTWSHRLDLLIVAKTLPAVIAAKGAY
jgi:lipopolysaccharide/colanic/teichoic acid biosynthesis glycosyltransferase